MTHTQHKTIKTFLIASCLILFNVTLQAKTIHKSYDLEAGGHLYLKTDGGGITIETHDKDEVLLDVDLNDTDPDDLTITHKTTTNSLDIVAKTRKKLWSNARILFTLTVPKTLDLELDTSGGSIKIADLKGKIDAHTSGGSIKVKDIEGNIELHTSGGSISIGHITGHAKISTSGGSINVDSVSGNLNAHTSGGSISATLTEQISKDAKLSTAGGTINLNLPKEMYFNINAKTNGGRVRTDFSVDGKVKKRAIQGKVNGGGPNIRLRTSGGSINVNMN